MCGCNAEIENTGLKILHCNFYSAQRFELFNDINKVHLSFTQWRTKEEVNSLLYGHPRNKSNTWDQDIIKLYWFLWSLFSHLHFCIIFINFFLFNACNLNIILKNIFSSNQKTINLNTFCNNGEMQRFQRKLKILRRDEALSSPQKCGRIYPWGKFWKTTVAMLVDYLVYPSSGVEIPIEKQGAKE